MDNTVYNKINTYNDNNENIVILHFMHCCIPVQAGGTAQDWGCTTQRSSGSTMPVSWPQACCCRVIWTTASLQMPLSSTPMACAIPLSFPRYVGVPCGVGKVAMISGKRNSAFVYSGPLSCAPQPQLEDAPVPDLHVFALVLHTHLAGRKVRVGHFR